MSDIGRRCRSSEQVALMSSSSRFTMRLDPELKDWLEEEARRQDRSAAWLAKQAIEGLKRSTEAKRLMIHEALAWADQGSFVSQQAVHTWMGTWDTEHEAPPPKPDVQLQRR
jgi:predicted transcriptional regulator